MSKTDGKRMGPREAVCAIVRGASYDQFTAMARALPADAAATKELLAAGWAKVSTNPGAPGIVLTKSGFEQGLAWLS